MLYYLTGSTRDLTVVLDILLVAVGPHTVTVGELVVAGVGAGRGHARAQAAGHGAALCNVRLVAGSPGHVSAVAKPVVAGLHGGQWGIRGPDNLLAGYGRDRPANTAHVDATLESDESVLSPVGSPAVLDEPVVLAIGRSIAHNRNGVVSIR